MNAGSTKSLADINSFIKNEKDASENEDFTKRIGTIIQYRVDSQSRLNSVNFTTINPEQCINLVQNGGKETIQGLIETVLYLLTCAHAPDDYNSCTLCANALAILRHRFNIVNEFSSPTEMQEPPANSNDKKDSAKKPDASKKEEKHSTKIRSRKTESPRARKTQDRSPPRYKTHDVATKYAVYYKTINALSKRTHYFTIKDYKNSFIVFNHVKVDRYNAGRYFRHALLDFEIICSRFHHSEQDYIARKLFGYRTAEMDRLFWHPIFKNQLNKFLEDYKESPIRIIKDKVLDKAFRD